MFFFFFSSRRRHTRYWRDWSSDVCSSDLDVLVDGVTAYETSQWAGIEVGDVTHGFLPEARRSTNVVIRNSVVHDVAGDGIVLFQVNHGVIESSVAWHTGMQETETIGTPNAIWTWMCGDCTVRRNEAFLVDSPGVD